MENLILLELANMVINLRRQWDERLTDEIRKEALKNFDAAYANVIAQIEKSK